MSAEVLPTSRAEASLIDPDADSERVIRLAEKAMETVGQLAKRPNRDPVRAGILAGVVSSVLLWGAHEHLGGKATTERHQQMSNRIDALEAKFDQKTSSIEETQIEIRLQLGAISRAVGADGGSK